MTGEDIVEELVQQFFEVWSCWQCRCGWVGMVGSRDVSEGRQCPVTCLEQAGYLQASGTDLVPGVVDSMCLVAALHIVEHILFADERVLVLDCCGPLELELLSESLVLLLEGLVLLLEGFNGGLLVGKLLAELVEFPRVLALVEGGWFLVGLVDGGQLASLRAGAGSRQADQHCRELLLRDHLVLVEEALQWYPLGRRVVQLAAPLLGAEGEAAPVEPDRVFAGAGVHPGPEVLL